MIMRGRWVMILERAKRPKLIIGTQRPEELKKEMFALMESNESQ